MNKILYKISLLLLAAVLVAGCSEDFLEVPPKGQVSSDNFLTNDEELKQALIGVYDLIQYNYSHGGWASVYFIKNLPADDLLAAGGSPTDQQEYQYLDDFNILADNSKIESIWSNFYKTINSCNTIINNLAERTDLDANMTSMLAEAKAIRAFTYLDLVTMFGGVPLLIVNPETEADYHKPRASAADVYTQIQKDLTEAIPVLKLKSQYTASERFRFAKGTARAVLGKAYLYQEKYTEAASVLGDIIASGEYGLEPDFANVWDIINEFGVESLFEVSYVSSEAYDWGNFPWGGGNESNIEAQLQGPRDIYFNVSGSSLGVINGWGFNLPSAEIGDMFVADLEAGNNDSSRYFGTLISALDFEATGGEVLVSVDDDPAPHDYEGYMRLKYVTRSSTTGDQGVPELNHGINWRIIRYADVLLMAAEAYLNNDNDAAALTELAKVYARARGLTPADAETIISNSGNSLLDMIIRERAMELAFEGSRYWDLIRWGMAEAELGDLGFVAGRHELFPIPQNEIIANNAIDQADQNPGYGN